MQQQKQLTYLHAWLLFAPLFLGLLAADQLSKWWAAKTLSLGQSKDLGFVLHHNADLAFGFQLPTWVIYPLTLGIILIGLYLVIRHRLWQDTLHLIGLSLIAAGAIGNVIDRFRLGYVIDFIKVYFWPIFNLADVWIVVGVFLVMFLTLFREDFAKQI